MQRILVIMAVVLCLMPVAAKKKQAVQKSDREYWCQLAYQMAQPVLEPMSKGELS